MNRRSHKFALVAMLVIAGVFTCLLRAQVTAAPNSTSRILPQREPPKSPVKVFRELLAMAPSDREKYLVSRPPDMRKRIEAKLDEYLAMSPEERQLRLQVTELHWYLMPLMKMAPTNRAELLAQVPAELREVVQQRLDTWDIYPPSLKEEMLENEMALRYFVQPDLRETFQRPTLPLPETVRRWQAMSDDQRRSMIASFNQFFDLTPEEQKRAFEAFPEVEQREMEATLRSFRQMPPGQRAACLQAFAKLAGLNETERQQFLGNAALWHQMSPEERQQWRNLVRDVPDWPPLPIGFVPSGATNAN